MDDWIIDNRRVSYDGVSQEHAYAASLEAPCPSCGARLDLAAAEVIGQPMVEESGMDTQVRAVRCVCELSWLAACSCREWQPQRWIALEPLVTAR